MPPTKHKRIQDVEWEKLKSSIKELYLGENRPLGGKEGVIELMKYRYGFHASKAQYERRFKGWGFRKYVGAFPASQDAADHEMNFHGEVQERLLAELKEKDSTMMISRDPGKDGESLKAVGSNANKLITAVSGHTRALSLIPERWRCTASAITSSIKRYMRKSPSPSTQRFEWTCECGEEMFADFAIAGIDSLREMRSFLNKQLVEPLSKDHRDNTSKQSDHSPSESDVESGMGEPSHPKGTGLAMNKGSVSSIPSASSTSSDDSSLTASTKTTSGPHGSPLTTTNSTTNKFLELCINVSRYETKLAEIRIPPGHWDAELFRNINEQYFRFRKRTWRRILYRPAGIRFVHFGLYLDAAHRVSFFSGNSLPPTEVIAARQYEFNVRPPNSPPIDSRTFMHYFWKHGYSKSSSGRWLNRLPKKLGESLVHPSGPVIDDIREGWGIHILEGPNKPAICWALLLALLVSFFAALGYDLMVQSTESGFAIGQWAVAALAISLSATYFELEDHVNLSYD